MKRNIFIYTVFKKPFRSHKVIGSSGEILDRHMCHQVNKEVASTKVTYGISFFFLLSYLSSSSIKFKTN